MLSFGLNWLIFLAENNLLASVKSEGVECSDFVYKIIVAVPDPPFFCVNLRIGVSSLGVELLAEFRALIMLTLEMNLRNVLYLFSPAFWFFGFVIWAILICSSLWWLSAWYVGEDNLEVLILLHRFASAGIVACGTVHTETLLTMSVIERLCD